MPNLTGGMQNTAHWWRYHLLDKTDLTTTFVSANGGVAEAMPTANATIRVANNSDVGIYVRFTNSAVVPTGAGILLPAGQVDYFNFKYRTGTITHMWVGAVSGTGKHVNIAIMTDKNLGAMGHA